MKKLLLSFVLIGIAFAGGLMAPRWIQSQGKEEVNSDSTEEFFGTRFIPNPFPIENRPFVVIIVGANNGGSVEKTLTSVFAQTYEHFRTIYIDDASNDGSFEVARDLIYNSEHLLQVTLVQNEERLGELANLYRAMQSCSDDEIAVVLGGEDWLAHEWVLQRLNGYYADPDLWLTFGQSIDFPTFQRGVARPVSLSDWKERGFRGHPFIASGLKTFYVGLFKQILEADFVLNGQFLPTCSDLAYMIPMLEMARDHFQCIPEVLYVHNLQSLQREDRDLQFRCEKYVRSLNSYPCLASLSLHPAECVE
jgi:glycosyltransferase involved in cell wall biosynthesis